MKRVVILTGSELRHTYLRKAFGLCEKFEVVRSYCEGSERGLRTAIDFTSPGGSLQEEHILARERSEEDFFGSFVGLTPDLSNPWKLDKGAINESNTQEEIIKLRPDVVIAYGCSIVKEPLLSHFAGRFLNVHLGLSPYYRGSGTNYWSLVNNEPEFFGATFMHMAQKVDSGPVIHQIRARIFPGDTPHSIGNRLICDVAAAYIRIVDRLEDLPEIPQIKTDQEKYYRQRDFTPESVTTLYRNFKEGLVDSYLSDRKRRDECVPIAVNSAL